jgi:PAS domain S-box-containing protein
MSSLPTVLLMPTTDTSQLPPGPPLSLEAEGLSLDAFPLGITVADAQGRILQANAAASLLLGLPVAEHLARSIQGPEWKLFQADGSQVTVESFPGQRALREQRRIEEPEMGILRPDGSVVWLNISAVPLGPDRVLITYVDVTEAKRVREALWQSEVQNRALIKAIPDLVFTNRRDGEYLAFHAKDEQGLLVPPEAFLHRKLEEVLPTPLAQRFLAIFEEVLDTRAVREVEYSLPMAGEERQFEARVVPGTEDTVVTIVRDVTERRQAEAALKASETLYRELLERQGEGFGMVDAEERFVVANPVAEAIFGVAPGQLLGRALLDFLPPDQQELVRHESSLRAQGAHNTYELQIRRADGALRTLLVTATPGPMQKGKPFLSIGVFRDITERKEFDARLLASEARLRRAENVARFGNWEYDLVSRRFRASEGAKEIYGLQGQAFSPAEVQGLVLPEYRARLDVAMAALIEHDRPYDVEFCIQQPGDGDVRHIHSIAEYDRKRKVVFGVIKDATAPKLAEAALRESEAQLRVIFEATGAGIILVSPKGEIDYANHHMANMLGVTSEALIGSQYVSHLHPAERHRGDERMRQLVAGEVSTVAVERRYLRADGTDFWGHLAGRRLEHPDGSLRALVGIITDISQRKKAEVEQRNLQAQLNQAQKLESLGSLAGGVAHDMNNVLGAILGLASAHIESQVPGSPTHRAFSTIIKATERGGTMLKSLLSFARQGSAEMRELDLNAILREEVHLLERTTLAKVHLVLDLALDLRPMQGDASALTHAFMNLCVNAVDAMPEHGTLTLRTRNLDEGWIEVQVEDTGQGMASDILEKALDPFFTTKDVGKGTGLGLSIVYSTVQAHQGKIELWSQPGQGTCVTMRFPACTTAAQDPTSSGKFQTTGARKRLDILLVDDDELIQSSMQAILEVLGHRVFIATRGEEALAKLHAGLLPDLVILDMNMPGLGGAGTLPRLRAQYPKLPVLLATGRADQAAVNLVEAHAHVTLLAKPFSMKQLQKFLEPIGR